MGNNLKIMGNTFSNVSSITAHDATSGTHKYIDASGTTATAADIKSGKKIYDANGTEIQGTIGTFSVATSSYDLTNTTWYFNDYSQINFNLNNYYINFTSADGQEFKRICGSVSFGELWYTKAEGGTTYIEGGWTQYPELRTIRINNGADIKNSTLINWLHDNATLIDYGKSDVNFVYNNFPALSSNDGMSFGNIANKICVGDISIYPRKEVEEKDVNFIDYDGTILYSYTASQFADLSELPPNPSHDGLTATGWNWTLSNAKTYVSDYKKLWIGQLYQTSDGATRIYIDLKEGNLSPYLGVCGWSGTSGVAMDINIDWGDGSSSVASPLNWFSSSDIVSTQHTYSNPGQYCITVTRANNSGWYCFMGGGVSYNYSSSDIGSTILWGNSANKTANRCYQDAIIKFEQGDYCNIGPQAFAYCKNLSTIVISNHTNQVQNLYEICESFIGCTSLKSLTFPVYAGDGFDNTYKALTYQLFKDCINLKNISFGYYVQSGSSTNTNRFLGCFQNCSLISSIAIPSTATYIGNYAFSNCESLHEIYIPANVTTIGSSVFENCYSLKRIYFKSTTPPTISNSNTWSNIASDYIVFIPGDTSSIISSYLSATNYPSSRMGTESFALLKGYIGYATFASGASLFENVGDNDYMVKWYATKEAAIADTGTRLTQGTGKEIYCSIRSTDA